MAKYIIDDRVYDIEKSILVDEWIGAEVTTLSHQVQYKLYKTDNGNWFFMKAPKLDLPENYYLLEDSRVKEEFIKRQRTDLYVKHFGKLKEG